MSVYADFLVKLIDEYLIAITETKGTIHTYHPGRGEIVKMSK